MCKLNKELEDRVAELVKERETLMRVMINFEFQATKKEKKL